MMASLFLSVSACRPTRKDTEDMPVSFTHHGSISSKSGSFSVRAIGKGIRKKVIICACSSLLLQYATIYEGSKLHAQNKFITRTYASPAAPLIRW
jgi:hypothetical protein